MARVREFMSSDVITVGSGEMPRDAARLMRQHDVGVLPVVEGDTLVGVITDRDLVIRALADDRLDIPVGSILSGSPVTVGPDDEDSDVASMMADREVRRVPVVEDGRVVGMVSVGDLATRTNRSLAGEVMEETGPEAGR